MDDTGNTGIRILVAEDSALVREGLIALLERAGHTVVDGVADAPALLRAAAEHPDTQLVVTDVRMPPGNTTDGLEAAIAIRAAHPSMGVLVLSQYVADAYVAELLQSDAAVSSGVGYLLKDRIGRVQDFLRSLEVVAAGGVVVDPEVVQRMLARGPQTGPLARLTDRERQVLALMAEGRANTEIAAALVVSDAAVAKHIGNIFAKLDLGPDDGHRRVRAVLAWLRG